MSFFTADDAALAAQQMTDVVTADIPWTDRAQYDRDFANASAQVNAKVTKFAKIFGLHALGDPSCGDQAVAEKVASDIADFSADPAAYLEKVNGGAPAKSDDNTPAAVVATSASTPAPADPVVASSAPIAKIEQAVHVAPFEVPAAKVTLKPAIASMIFKDVPSAYANDVVPYAQWETPKPHIPAPDDHFAFDGYHISVMAMAIDERKNVISTGDPGCGKTEFFRQFGARIGLPVHKIPMDGSVTRAEIIGSFRQVATANGSETPFVFGTFPRLIQQPGIIIIDEIDQADPDIMYMIHPVLEGEDMIIQEEGGTVIRRHPHCYIVATANTKGRGSDNGLTHTRYEMSEATRDRFPYWLNFSFMKEDKEVDTIVKKTTMPIDAAKKLVAIANQIRTAYSNGQLSQTCSLRQLLDVGPAYSRFIGRGSDQALAMGVQLVMAGRANRDDAASIREFVRLQTNVDLGALEI